MTKFDTHIWNSLLNNFCSLCSIQISILLELFKKNWFLTIYTHFSKGRNSLKNCSILTKFFLKGSGHSNEVFLFFESYHFLKVMRRKCQKTEFHGGHLGFLAAILDWKNGNIGFQIHKTLSFPKMYSFHFLQKIPTIRNWTNRHNALLRDDRHS